MRVPDYMLKSSAFVVSIASEDNENEYDFEASGFLLGFPSEVAKGLSFFYFVTADHVVSRIKNRTGIRVNLKQGGTTVVPVDQWFRHPTDRRADVAVTPFRNKYGEYDVQFIGENCFKSREAMGQQDIGIGDEVW